MAHIITAFTLTFVFSRPTIRFRPCVLLRIIAMIGTSSAVWKTRTAGKRLPHKGFRYTPTNSSSRRYCASNSIPQVKNFNSQVTRTVRAELVQTNETEICVLSGSVISVVPLCQIKYLCLFGICSINYKPTLVPFSRGAGLWQPRPSRWLPHGRQHRCPDYLLDHLRSHSPLGAMKAPWESLNRYLICSP